MNDELLLLVAAAVIERPEIRVTTFPKIVTQGKLLQVQAVAVKRGTDKPVRQKAFYLKIMAHDGRIVYPPSVMARNQKGFVIDIGTADFPKGHYTLMVSTNKNFSPSDTAFFDVKASSSQIPLPFFIPAPTVKTPAPSTLTKRIRDVVIPLLLLIPKDKQTTLVRSKVIFRTQEDASVCPICDKLDNKVYSADDKDKPVIPQHPNCRCYYEYIDG